MFKKFIGDRAFYRRAMAIAIPIMIQNGITNFVAMLDNIMVGRIGQMQMNGVGIVNQLIFVFNLCIFGAVSGAGIFTAQFHGNQDQEGIRRTFRYKFIVSILVTILGIGVFLLAGQPLIQLYMQGDDSPETIACTLAHSKEYLTIMLFGLLPFALTNVYSGTLRETGKTVVPMVASLVAVLTNLVLNYVLIFGHLGLPAMGVRGAAIATVVSRYIELLIVAIWMHLNTHQCPYIVGVYRSLYIPGKLLKRIIINGLPLLINELLWASGMAVLNQCYSTRGLDVVAAINICSTLINLASVTFLSLGNVVGIVTGQLLGAGVPEAELRDNNRKLIFLSVSSCVVFSILAVCVSGIFPQIYDASDVAKHTATILICIYCCVMPFSAYCHACYFSMRSGGKTMITFVFDCGYVWAINVPLAFCLSRFTALPIAPMYAICLSTELSKCILGYIMLKQGKWIQNLTKEQA